jgi:hypothetical protein
MARKKRVKRDQRDGRGQSKYARKLAYLRREGTPDWGFLVPSPKPWKWS